MRKAAGTTWADYETNTEIAKELNTTPYLEKNTGIRKKLDMKRKEKAS